MRNLKGQVLFGECFLIFWNIFTISMENEHTTIWEKESPTDVSSTHSNQSVRIDLNQEIREMIMSPEEEAVKTFEYHHNGNDSQSISFLISTCKTAEIEWILKYQPENETSKITGQNSPPKVLAKYTAALPRIYVGKALRGTYLVEVKVNSTMIYFLYVSMDPMDVDFLRQSEQMKRERAITFKKNLKNSSLTFRWPKWSWKNREVVYVIKVNEEKYIFSGCQYEHYEWTSTRSFSTTNTAQELQNLEPGRTYYVSIFIRTKNKSLLPYLQGRVTFPKSTSHTLKDGTPTKMKLTPDDDRLTFRYKVRNRQFPESENEIRWYVISCVGPLQIEINHRKNTVLEKQLVPQFHMFKIPKPNIGSRYVLKVTSANGELQNDKSNGNIEVFATMQSKLFPFPNVSNLDLRLHGRSDQNHHLYGRVSYLVEFSPASDNEPVRYCMRVFNKKDETKNDVWEINHCTKMKKKLDKIGNSTVRHCITTSENNSRIRLPINNLELLTDYVVYVSARKKGFKRRIWYNPLFIQGNDFIP